MEMGREQRRIEKLERREEDGRRGGEKGGRKVGAEGKGEGGGKEERRKRTEGRKIMFWRN